MLQTKHVEKQNTHFVFSNFFFRKSCLLWDKMKKFCRESQATDENMAHAHWCCTPKDTNTHSEYVILTVFPQQQWLYERTSMLRYTYIAYLFFLLPCNFMFICDSPLTSNCHLTVWIQSLTSPSTSDCVSNYLGYPLPN